MKKNNIISALIFCTIFNITAPEETILVNSHELLIARASELEELCILAIEILETIRASYKEIIQNTNIQSNNQQIEQLIAQLMKLTISTLKLSDAISDSLNASQNETQTELYKREQLKLQAELRIKQTEHNLAVDAAQGVAGLLTLIPGGSIFSGLANKIANKIESKTIDNNSQTNQNTIQDNNKTIEAKLEDADRSNTIEITLLEQLKPLLDQAINGFDNSENGQKLKDSFDKLTNTLEQIHTLAMTLHHSVE